MSGALATAYDGVSPEALAERLGVPLARVFTSIGSTQDEAHRLAAEGASAGTIVLADEQLAGRGRGGRRWTSRAGAGIWMSLIARPDDAAAIEVLSLRLGIELARALDPLAGAEVRLKWPNDLYLVGGKLAGILVEARWREASPEWVVVGVGLNIAPPESERVAAGLAPGTSRLEALDALVAATLRVVATRGALTAAELDAFARRDLARGRRCSAPEAGVVQGITAAGALLVATAAGLREQRGGSLVLEENG